MNPELFWKISEVFFSPLVVGFSVGYALWLVGQQGNQRALQSDAIRELMAYRGDTSSLEFSRALNKVSIVFHKDADIRKEIRELYEAINNSVPQPSVNRKIVSLIYDLCQKNGFKKITEYDIDQSFPEIKQTPVEENGTSVVSAPTPLSVESGPVAPLSSMQSPTDEDTTS